MQMGEGSTSAAESGSFSFHFTGVMSRIHLDPDWGHRNSLNNRHHMSSEGRMLQTQRRPRPHLVSKQDHDGVASRSRRGVLHREGVVVVPDDVKVDVGLCWSHHSRSALDPNADVT